MLVLIKSLGIHISRRIAKSPFFGLQKLQVFSGVAFHTFPKAAPSALEFLSATLRFDPEQRVPVTEARKTCWRRVAFGTFQGGASLFFWESDLLEDDGIIEIYVTY